MVILLSGMASTPGLAVTWSANQEIVIQTFSFSGSVFPYFQIAHDAYAQSVLVNDDYYIEINGYESYRYNLLYSPAPPIAYNVTERVPTA